MEDIIHHQSSQFDEELGRLRSNVLKMGGLVENQVAQATEAYRYCDVSLANSIVARDKDVNALEKEIDDDCAHVIARRQPTASDLRLVFGIIKIVTDLERIGDEAKKFAKGIRRVCESGQAPVQIAPGIRHLGDTVAVMVREALDAFARLDVRQGEKVINDDTNVDIEFKAIVRQLMTYMMEDPRTISQSLDLMFLAKSIERIGDHAKNIAEFVIYIVKGLDVRHTPLQAIESQLG